MNVILVPLGVSHANLLDVKGVLTNMLHEVSCPEVEEDTKIPYEIISEDKNTILVILNETGVPISVLVSKIVSKAILYKVNLFFFKDCHDSSILGVKNLGGRLDIIR